MTAPDPQPPSRQELILTIHELRAQLAAQKPDGLDVLIAIEHALNSGHTTAEVLDENSPIRDALRARIRAARAAQPAAQEPRHLTDVDIATVWTKFDGDVEGDPRHIVAFARMVLALSAQASAQEPVDLQSIEQYRQQMAGISTAAIGYWKEGDPIHPDYDTPALRDVARLYAKYAELYEAAAQEQSKPVLWVARAKCDSENTVVGELSVEDISEKQFEMHDPDVWECIPLYTHPAQPAAQEPSRALTESDLPHHPDSHAWTWTEAEKRAILRWGTALLARTSPPAKPPPSTPGPSSPGSPEA